ncbi:37078_t:CDS:2, partial [Gigaspora margarita]
MLSVFATILYIETVTTFGSFTALCKYLDINQNKLSYFTLEHRGYNPLTSKYLIPEVTCAYDAGSSRHSGVAKAIETKVVISMCKTINLDENEKSDQLENHIEDAGNNKTNDVNSEQNESQDTSKK